MSEITDIASVLLIKSSALAAEKFGLTRREVVMFAFGVALADEIEKQVLDSNNLNKQICDSLMVAASSLPIILGDGADG